MSTRVYTVTITATIVRTDQGPVIVEPEQYMTVRGSEVKYVKPHGDMLFLQILNPKQEVLFSCPANIVKSVWTPTYPQDKEPPPAASQEVMAEVINIADYRRKNVI